MPWQPAAARLESDKVSEGPDRGSGWSAPSSRVQIVRLILINRIILFSIDKSSSNRVPVNRDSEHISSIYDLVIVVMCVGVGIFSLSRTIYSR